MPVQMYVVDYLHKGRKRANRGRERERQKRGTERQEREERGLHVRVAVHLARLHELDGLVDARLRHGVGGLGEFVVVSVVCCMLLLSLLLVVVVVVVVVVSSSS